MAPPWSDEVWMMRSNERQKERSGALEHGINENDGRKREGEKGEGTKEHRREGDKGPKEKERGGDGEDGNMEMR